MQQQDVVMEGDNHLNANEEAKAQEIDFADLEDF